MNQDGQFLQLVEDWAFWINAFTAYHEKYGYIYGDFEKEVYSENDESIIDFIFDHPHEVWDYWDIWSN